MTRNTPAYQLKNIRQYYGVIKALDIDALDIPSGSITGLIGPNGSGKSTLLKLLAFALAPTEGQILYKGRQESLFSPAVRLNITLLTQKPYLLKRTVYENVIYGLKIRKDMTRLDQRVKDVLSTVGLDFQQFAHRKWHQLSGGEAQRVALAARLILKPEVLLLDEPIASVDAESAGMIRQATLKARRDWGTTLIIASHDLQWLYSISDSQLSVYRGKLFPAGIENIITGPFEASAAGTVVKPLGDGQVIVLNAPSEKSQTAIIRKNNIVIHPENAFADHPGNVLSGQMISMLSEKNNTHIMATVRVHDLSFFLQVTPDQISRLNLYPGKKMTIGFHAGDVEWF